MPVMVEYGIANYPYAATTWYDVTDDFAVEAGPTARDIVVFPTTPLDFDAQLVYRIKPVRTGDAMLRCANLTATSDVAVADYTYTIWVSGY